MALPAMRSPDLDALIFDLEAVPAHDAQPARIIKVGALRPDTGAVLEMNTPSARELQSALQRLEALAEGARCAVGHNLLAHDLPLLRSVSPDSRLLQLPVIDTLRLSPLAFPQNRLIKDYKLISASLNSPLADCRATLSLLMDQQQGFLRLAEQSPGELACYQALIAPQPGPGLGDWLQGISRRPAPTPEQLQSLLPALLRESDPVLPRDLKVCRPRLQALLDDDLLRADQHWPIAYALAWLRVSGGNSVLAPWVRHQFPQVGRLIAQLRDTPCADPACQYCRSTHDPRQELQRYFGFEDFRLEPDGRSLQHDIVLAGMQGRHVLAILATGGGKSLCYQLPALNRYHRNGSLTIVLSPLQSLMKDQVDGLLGKNVQCAATLNGMLTLPERADVLEKVQMGDVGILLVSPEQLRNKAFRNAIKHRQIGAWIFDEAHCLSKWGNDFRPDYLYASRFIREHTGGDPLPCIGCFSATAKLDVLADIRGHFREQLGLEFQAFLGTHERRNLDFDVLPCGAGEKWQQTHALLQAELGAESGGAVVFVASRKNTEELADFLRKQGWNCAHFHAGLPPQSKKDIQDAFIRGETRVIVATNAFGMGVDKPDIRLVVHAEIPGSLENYLQEAGRAGRDQQGARCVLLYDPQDIETQFGLSERSRLSHGDIRNILKKLRFESSRRRGEQLVITAGEILIDEAVETSFDAADRDAETKVATAVAWLERGDYLRRQENRTQVFPARLRLPTLAEACQRLDQAQLPQRRREEFRAVLAYLYDSKADERVNTDQLMLLTGQTQEEIAGMLKQLAHMNLLINDTQIDAAETDDLAHESAFLRGALLQLAPEFGECQLAQASIVDWLYDYARELRQQPRAGLFLGTVHAAKGLEFRHVVLLDGGWDRHARDAQDERRLFYVGMTRASETLTLCALGAHHPFQDGLPPAVLFKTFEGAPRPELDRRYQPLGLADVDLDYAGRQPGHAEIHRALRKLRPGDPLRLVPDDKGGHWLQDSQGTTVGRTAARFQLRTAPERVEAAAVLVRYADDVSDEAFSARLRCDRWEVVLPRIIGL